MCVCVLELVCVYLYMGMCLIALLLLSFMTNKVEFYIHKFNQKYNKTIQYKRLK